MLDPPFSFSPLIFVFFVFFFFPFFFFVCLLFFFCSFSLVFLGGARGVRWLLGGFSGRDPAAEIKQLRIGCGCCAGHGWWFACWDEAERGA